MKGLEKLCKQVDTPERVAAAEKRRQEYRALRHSNLAEIKSKGGIALSVGWTKCLDCGKVEGMQRLGCSCVDMARAMSDKEYAASLKWVVHGSFVIDGLNEDSSHISGAFLSHKELHSRLLAGERFFDGVSEINEITLAMFEEPSGG